MCLKTYSLLVRVAFLIVLFPLGATALPPCYDSDGDGWADPEAATDSCPADNCPGIANTDQQNCYNAGDPVADGVFDVQDVVRTIDLAFRGMMPGVGEFCPAELHGGTDVDCDGATGIMDVIKVINVVFRGHPSDFCEPCHCDCYPTGCSGGPALVNLIPNNGSFEKYCDSTLEGWSSTFLINILQEPAPNGGNWSIHLQADWTWWGWAECEVAAPIPGGIYRFTAQYRARVPEFGSWGVVSLRYGSHITSREYESDGSWIEVGFVDTLPNTPGAQLKLRLEAYNSHLAVEGEGPQFDLVTLEYIGQPAP